MKSKNLIYGTCFVLFFICSQANAVSISAFRMFLDASERFTELTVHNSELKTQVCSITLSPLGLTKDGLVKNRGGEVLPSPKRFVRFAPSKFELKPQQSQAFKAIYRRIPNVEQGEYIAAAAIKCKDKDVTTNEQTAIQPSLVHNVPLIVRNGKLDAYFNFLNVTKANNQVEAELKVTGDRSVTGELLLINAQNNEVIDRKKRVSIYPQWDKHTVKFTLSEDIGDKLLLKFVETKKSGKIVQEYLIQ